MQHFLKIEHLSKEIDGRTIIHNLDLTLAKNSFTVLLGPSGCGKSTFFETITGIKKPSSGKIILEGEEVDSLQKSAAYMQQKDLLLPWLTLFENALLPARCGGWADSSAKTQCDNYLKDFGIAKAKALHPHEVSGGMRQRCALARTLMFERDIILLDEPLSALDAITRSDMQQVLFSLQQDFGKTILMITHDIDEALLLADTLHLMSSIPMQIKRSYQLKSEKPRDFRSPEQLELKAMLLDHFQKERV